MAERTIENVRGKLDNFMEKVLHKECSKCDKFDRQTRDYGIDLIRVLACVAVVGLHTIPKDHSLPTAILYYLCGFAVPVFFMSSGYFLLNRGHIVISYSKRKCFGIIRIIVCWNFIIAGLRIMYAMVSQKKIVDEILRFPAECIKCVLQKGTLWHFWYLSSLMIIYMLLPILSKFSTCFKIS